MCLSLYNIKQNTFLGVNNGGKTHVFAPCGYCEDCARTAQYSWAWRLTSDLQYYVKERGYKVGFITLTYNEESLPRIPYKYGKDIAGMSCFSKDHTNKLILYLRKTLHRDFGCKEFLYFLASERGPNGTHRPHYHLIIAWDPSCGLTAFELHKRIRHWWSEDIDYREREPWGNVVVRTRKALGFVTPRDLMGGEKKRDGTTILPFEVNTMDNLLKSAFYTAKYVMKDIYFMREIKDKVPPELLKSPSFKNYLPHHRQSKSLGFHGIASLSDAQKIELLLRGKNLLSSNKLSMPPLYIQNKLLFKPCYIIGQPTKEYPNGKRYSFRQATQFYNDYFNLIFDNKVKYYVTLFEKMGDVQYWLDSIDESKLNGDSPRDWALSMASYVRFNDCKELFGCSMAEAYLTYYGMHYRYCYQDKKLCVMSRFKHPTPTFSAMPLIPYEHWWNIQEFFSYLMSACRWQADSMHDEKADVVRSYWNQLA